MAETAMRILGALAGLAVLALGLQAFAFGVYATGPGSIFGVGEKAVILSLTVAGLVAACTGLVTVIRGYSQPAWWLYGAAVTLYALGYGLPFAIAESF